MLSKTVKYAKLVFSELRYVPTKLYHRRLVLEDTSRNLFDIVIRIIFHCSRYWFPIIKLKGAEYETWIISDVIVKYV